jgi:DNA-binding transcriptional regulator YbjK
MPRITTTDLASHRDWRRSQLIEAAAALALESGGAAITVAAVASRAGLSRTSVYESKSLKHSLMHLQVQHVARQLHWDRLRSGFELHWNTLQMVATYWPRR